MARTYSARITLTLKQDFERYERVHLHDPNAIDSAIAAASCDVYLLEARLSQYPLTESFKRVRSQKGVILIQP